MATFYGCTRIFQNKDAPLSSSTSSDAQIAFEEALSDYDSGDFEGALTRFRALSATGFSDAVSQKAKIGEIYCHLMLAKTRADFLVAVEMWQELNLTTKKEGESWAITLTDPLVYRLQPYGEENKMKGAPSSATMSPEGEQQLDTKQVDQLQRKMNKIIKENQSLKKKIKALEAIDQNIQRKKSEISITDEQTRDKEE